MFDNINNYADYTFGAGAGYLAYKGAKKVGVQARKPYVNEVLKQMQNFSAAENEALKKATYEGFASSGLASKPNKFYLHDVNSENVDSMRKLITRKFNAIPLSRKLRKLKDLKGKRRPLNAKEKEELANAMNNYLKNKEYKKAWQEFKNACKGKPIEVSKFINALETDAVKIDENCIKSKLNNSLKTFKDAKDRIIKSDKSKKLSSKMKSVAEGKNAFCSPFTRDIMINMDKLPGASFHEMGHALNASGSKAIKALAIGRHITALAVPLILAVGLLKPKKKDGQESKGFIDKATTFIKNNAGKLAFAALIPTLAEEGLASIRGAQIAKKVLDPKLLKKVNRNNLLAWTTYLTGAMLTAGAVALAVEIRDKIAEKR